MKPAGRAGGLVALALLGIQAAAVHAAPPGAAAVDRHQAAVALGLAAVPPAPGSGQLALAAGRGGPAPGLRLSVPPPAPATARPAPTAQLRRLIDAAARAHGHDAPLLHAIIHVESRFDPNAVSPKGAIGLMQVMPATAERLGVREAARALFDPATNLDAGARYLRLLLDMFDGRPDLAVAAYNAGEGAVLRYRGQVPPYSETQAYVRRVMKLYLQAQP